QASPKCLAPSHQHRGNGDVQRVNRAGLQILANHRDATTDAHIPVSGCRLRQGQRFVDATGDEMKRRAPVHYRRFASMLGQHKGWYMIRRTLSPPAAPTVIRPRTAHRAEHITTENPRVDILETTHNEV